MASSFKKKWVKCVYSSFVSLLARLGLIFFLVQYPDFLNGYSRSSQGRHTGGSQEEERELPVHSVVSAVWQPVQLCSIPQPLPGFPAPASPHPVDTSASSGPLAPAGHLLPEVLVPAVQCFHSDGACLPQMMQVSATCVLPLLST